MKPTNVAFDCVAASLGLVAVASVIRCTPALQQVITADIVAEVNCVEGQVAQQNQTYESIAVVCGIQAVQDVVTIVAAEELDGGALASKAALVHHASTQIK
jgi:hypothetical protein